MIKQGGSTLILFQFIERDIRKFNLKSNLQAKVRDKKKSIYQSESKTKGGNFMANKLSLSYRNVNGALYPELQISRNPDANKRPVGKYGQMYLNYLKDEHSERYAELRMSGELMSLIHKVNDATHEQIKELTCKLMNQYPSTTDTMKKFRQRNTCQAMAEEIILKEFLYKIR